MIGLRGQILSALTAALVVSFALLAIAVVQLTERAQQLDRKQTAEAVARLVSMFHSEESRAFDVFVTDLLAEGDVSGVEVVGGGEESRSWGMLRRGVSARQTLPSGRTLVVWIASRGQPNGALSRMLLFYVAMTAGGILLFAYVVLTAMIVRPLESLTRASERLAAGNLSAQVPVRGAGEVSRLAVSFNNMAAQLRADRGALEDRLAELESTTTQLDETQEQLVRSARLASVGRLSAGLAHEIGNPLAAIVGLLELAQDPALDSPKRNEFLARSQRETERIHAILQELLAFARAGQARDSTGDEQRTALEAVLDEAVELVRPQKDLRDARIVRSDEGEGPFWVAGAQDRWTQVVVNLLLNAADAIADDGTITVGLRRENENTVLKVVDNGSGIDEDILSDIFDPFVTSKAPGKGTGLGLSVSHAFIESLGGQMRAHNNPDRGATLEVWLPADSVV